MTTSPIPHASASANSRQIGGTHYSAHGRKDLQHWDIVNIFKLDYFQGNITKYLFRWRSKAGLDDLLKSRHYLDKYIEIVAAQERDEADAAMSEQARAHAERP